MALKATSTQFTFCFVIMTFAFGFGSSTVSSLSGQWCVSQLCLGIHIASCFYPYYCAFRMLNSEPCFRSSMFLLLPLAHFPYFLSRDYSCLRLSACSLTPNWNVENDYWISPIKHHTRHTPTELMSHIHYSTVIFFSPHTTAC